MKIRFLLFLILGGCIREPHKQAEDFSTYRIEVIAPASQCETDFLANLPVMFNGLYEDDYKRAKMLKAALLNNNNDVLWALRGGYGSAKVVEILYDDQDFLAAMRKKQTFPKVIGYCDITALHLFLSQEFNWQTVHGPIFREIKNKRKQNNFKAIKKLLEGVKQIKFFGLQPLNEAAQTTQVISGKLTGGNLTMIQTSIGTRWEIQTKDKILFLEDCNEKPWRIDRTLHHLKSTKLLNDVKAIIIGNLCDNSNYMKETLRDFAKKLLIPIYTIDVFGHGVYNYPMIYNADVEITSERGIKILKQSNL
jgi:muramoyltetrapeptide carboxypeptidase